MPKKPTQPDQMTSTRERELYETVAKLQGLAQVAGMLKVITNEHACIDGLAPRTGEEHAACAAYPHSLKKPAHFVLHDVVRLEGPDDKGRMTAFTAEGDWTRGYPDALLRRLLEHVTEA